MTFLSWAPEASQDEAVNRFGARRYLNRAAKNPMRGLAVCVECVRADRQPYVRLPWLLGWLAICPVHDVVMVSRCPGCRGALEVPVPGSRRVISADRCTRCGHRLVNESVAKALPAASALQDAMLIGKRTASLERAGIGSMAWPEFVMLSDLALGVFWCQADGARKSTIGLALAQDEAGCDDLDIGNNREGCLVLLSWLLSTWVDGRAGEFVGEAWTRLVNEEWRSASANWGPSIEDVKLSQLGVLLSGLTH